MSERATTGMEETIQIIKQMNRTLGAGDGPAKTELQNEDSIVAEADDTCVTKDFEKEKDDEEYEDFENLLSTENSEDEQVEDYDSMDNVDLQDLPFPERLSVRRKTKLSMIKEAMTKSSGSGGGFTDMDGKVPAIPLPIIYTRGKICEKLSRPSKSYDVEDPHNQEKVINEPYNALHDPNAKKYFANPSVRRLLIEQGLLTPTGQVVCSLAEFNGFRKYLSKTIYNYDVKVSLDKYEKEQDKFRKIVSAKPPSSYGSRIASVREMAQKKKAETIQKFNENHKLKEERIQKCQLERERQRLDRILRADQKEQLRKNKILRQKEYELNSRARKIHFIEAKEKAEIAKKNVAMMNQERRAIEAIEKRIESLIEREANKQLMDKKLREEMAKNLIKRQQQFENHRSQIARRIKDQDAEDEHINIRELHKNYAKKLSDFNKKKAQQSHRPLTAPTLSETQLEKKKQQQNPNCKLPATSRIPKGNEKVGTSELSEVSKASNLLSELSMQKFLSNIRNIMNSGNIVTEQKNGSEDDDSEPEEDSEE